MSGTSSLRPTFLALGAGGIAGIVAACLVVLIAAALALYFCWFLPRARKRTSSRLTDSLQEIDSRLENDCGALIKRLETLARYSDRFREALEDVNSRRETITRTSRAQAKRSVDSMAVMVQEKRRDRSRGFHSFTRLKASCQRDVEEFDSDVRAFRQRLDTLLEDDTRLHSEANRVKEHLRDFKDFAADNSGILSPIKTVLDFTFKGLDEMFEQLDVYIDKADYESAQTLMDHLSSVVDALNEYRESLLYIIPQASTLLPNRIEELYRDYLRYTREGIPLDHLGVEQACESMCGDIQRVRDSLTTLDIGHDMEILQRVSNRIKELSEAFLYERDCAARLKAEEVDFRSLTYTLQQEAQRAENSYAEKRKQFVITPSNVEFIQNLPARLERGLHDKSYLDEITNATIPQPNSIILAKTQELSKTISSLREEIASFQEYLVSLEKDWVQTRESMDNLFISVYRLVALARKRMVPAFTEEVESAADQILDALDRVQTSLDSVPCDIVEVADLFGRVDISFREFSKSVQSRVSSAIQADGLMLSCNQYRPDYPLAKSGLGTAEEHLAKGEFLEAISILSELYSNLERAVAAQSSVSEPMV